MKIEAACGCTIGRIRTNNEDNLLFNRKTLPEANQGLRHAISQSFELGEEPSCFAVFDGMGGEEAGEVASFRAADTARYFFNRPQNYLTDARSELDMLVKEMNQAVCDAAEQLGTDRMGTTAVVALFLNDLVYICNIGDSKAFRLRDNALLQISEDHLEKMTPIIRGVPRKPRLTQHLGIQPDEMRLEPYLAKGELRQGDRYLLCSDGLTDMLTNIEICAIMKEEQNVRSCAEKLLHVAMEKGGKDNTTVIVCSVI